ncbi:DUF4352 domain-containing protein [Nocardiopsis sp. YSL2]|uniref:DUF4352 domain-containing protein n=1 Tax=Nocardiopsis sp. YSL2 TaxID=2939492 RepID=UPI0026F44147|nr:DUF4352 domain-containing protein [Nocardiopsis sp. YSL2]
MSSPQNPSGPQEPPFGPPGGQPPYGPPGGQPNFGPPAGDPYYGAPGGQPPYGPPGGDPNYGAPGGQPPYGPPGGDPNYGPPGGQTPYGPPGGQPPYGPPGGDPYYGAPGGDPHGSPYGAPPEQGMSTGAKVGLGVGGGCLVILVVLVVAGFLIGRSALSPEPSAPPSAAEPSAPQEGTDAPAEEEPEAADSGVAMTASNAGTTGDTLDPEAVYTVIDVTIENGSDEGVEVNPLYITATLDDGSSVNDWGETLFADIELIESGTLAPGDTVSGQIALVGEVDVTQVELQPVFGSNDPVAVAEVS